MSATDFDCDFIEDWGVFEDTKNIDGEISQSSFATDQSPVDVVGFPTVTHRRPSKSGRRTHRKDGVDGPKQRRSITGNRLPRKSRSLEGSAKAAVAAFAAQNAPGANDRRRSSMRRTKSEGLRRKSVSDALREHDMEEVFPAERRRRTSTAMRENERGGSRKNLEKEDSSSRVDRMKELGLAFRAATILEKSIVPRTEHLKKDILM